MRVVILLGALVASGVPAWAQSTGRLLAPADPSIPGRPLRYVPVTAGLKRYDVVEPKNWIELNKAVGPQPAKREKRDGGRR